MAWRFWGTTPAQNDDSSVTSSSDFRPILNHQKQESSSQSSFYYPQSTTGSNPGYIPESGMVFADPSDITPLEMLGDVPEVIQCPFCQTHSYTKLEEAGSVAQLLLGGALCFVSIPCMSVLTPLPCIFNWYEDIVYKCRNCTQMVARRPHNGGPIRLFRPPMA